jgi:hypothetical protein
MKTYKSSNILSRLIVIIEMIDKANLRIDQQQQYLFEYDHTDNIFAPIKLFRERKDIIEMINKYKRILARLIQSYSEVLLQLNYEALKNIIDKTTNPKIKQNV